MFTMLSNDKKKEILKDFQDFGLMDESLSRVILNQESEIKKEKQKIKKFINKNPDWFLSI